MRNTTIEVFVISDLHVGGEHPSSETARGFRICNHIEMLTRFVEQLTSLDLGGRDLELVINGDFVDFLAEEHGGHFYPFLWDDERASATLDLIARRERLFFEALAEFVKNGGRLTLLLGNHDVELSFPRVRARLECILGVREISRFRFLYDGEAYSVGDVLIEHGNRYDGFNVINHDRLRRVRSLQSRGLPVSTDSFTPPPGSLLVSNIINPMKKDYSFVDLLKPETEAVIPILLALDPRFRKHAWEAWRHKRSAAKHAPVAPATPAYGGDISANTRGGTQHDELESMLLDLMGEQSFKKYRQGVLSSEFSYGGDVASGDAGRRSLLRLFASRPSTSLEDRMVSLLEAVRCLRHDRSFDRGFELPEYLEHAQAMAVGRFRHVVFGHTHLAKRVDMGDGKMYINTGTWADIIRFPSEILSQSEAVARDSMYGFVQDLASGDLRPWVRFCPTYAQLTIQDEECISAKLQEFDGSINVEV